MSWIKVTDEEYNAIPALRSSDIQKLLRSPLHYIANKSGQSSTPAQVFGTIAHSLILERRDIKDIAIVGDKRTKTDKHVVSEKEYSALSLLAETVLSHPAAGKVLTQGVAEMAGVWTAPEDGLSLKIKPDYRRSDGVMVDLKTTLDASPQGFAKSVVNYKYAMQAAYYMDIASLIEGEEYKHWLWIAVEKDYPHATAVYSADEETIELGRAMYKRALKAYREAKASCKYVGYSEKITQLILPRYAFTYEEINS